MNLVSIHQDRVRGDAIGQVEEPAFPNRAWVAPAVVIMSGPLPVARRTLERLVVLVERRQGELDLGVGVGCLEGFGHLLEEVDAFWSPVVVGEFDIAADLGLGARPAKPPRAAAAMPKNPAVPCIIRRRLIWRSIAELIFAFLLDRASGDVSTIALCRSRRVRRSPLRVVPPCPSFRDVRNSAGSRRPGEWHSSPTRLWRGQRSYM